MYVSLNGQEVNVVQLQDCSVDLETYKTARADSYGYAALYRKLDNEALTYAVRNNMNNCMRHPRSTYDNTLQTILVPELLRRLEIYTRIDQRIRKLIVDRFKEGDGYINSSEYMDIVLEEVGVING